jgi:multiple sugar transport system ATP-binding protein
VYVTHDQVEALTMGDRVAVLKDGEIQQVGTPRELYDRPQNVFVAGFIGSPAMNLVELEAANGQVLFGDSSLPVLGAQGATTLGIRPEDLTLGSSTEGVELIVDVVEELGADAYVYGTAHLAGKDQTIVVRVNGRTPPARGQKLNIVPKVEHMHLFDTESGLRLAD